MHTARWMRWLGVSATAATMVVGAPREAEACSPEYIPAPGTIESVVLATKAVAKNTGIVVQVFAANDVTSATILENLSVTVRSGATDVPGTLKALGTGERHTRFVWSPTSGALPVGSAHATIDWSSLKPSDAPHKEEGDVLVADRTFAPAKGGLQIDVMKSLALDPASPVITCTPYVGSCTYGPVSIPTRAVGLPTLEYRLPQIESGDAYFIERTVDLYGRDASGATSKTAHVFGAASSASVVLDRAYETYCVKIATTFLIDGSKTDDELCAARSVDLTVTPAEEAAEVESRLASCDKVVYPAGTSAENPTGRAPSTPTTGSGSTPSTGEGADGDPQDGSGCSVGRSTSTTGGAGVLTVLGAALLLRRRVSARRRAPAR